MSASEQTLIEKLEQLSPEQQAEVRDFIEFLAAKKRREEALDQLREHLSRVPKEEITDEQMAEINAIVKEVRAERRNARR
jgi:hypothetical protein